MGKINQEEYEMLKALNNKWKWIARDATGDLYKYQNKPKRVNFFKWNDRNQTWSGMSNRTFQFIKWEDEEPYNIAELIEEYDSSKGIILHEDFDVDNLTLKELDGFKQTLKVIKESEETEVKKDKEWALNKLDDYLSVEGVNEARNALTFAKGVINQLDEPETLSQDWIDEYAQGDCDEWVYTEDLQNLLVPKQEENHLREQIDKLADFIMNEVEGEPSKNEGAVDTAIRIIREKRIQKPVIPASVAEYLDFAKSDVPLMRVLEIANTRNELPKWEKEYDWISSNDEKFARAWLDGYTVEKEQKYLVNILDEGTGAYLIYYPKSGNYGVTGILDDNKGITQFTEQEIKDYDERYFAFVKPVEEETK